MNFLTILMLIISLLGVKPMPIMEVIMIVTEGVTIHRITSRTRQIARKVGIDIPLSNSSLPDSEFEETDIM